MSIGWNTSTKTHIHACPNTTACVQCSGKKGTSCRMQFRYFIVAAILVCVSFELIFHHYLNRVKPNETPGYYHCKDAPRDRYSGIKNETIQYGRIKSGRKYAVFGSSIHDRVSTNYAFDLPLTAMAWKRIGFDSIIIIVGDPQQHKQQRWIQYLMDTLTDEDHIVVIVLKNVPACKATSISQVSRLFAASLLNYDKNDATMRDIYLITADADIWPIAKDFFVLPPGMDILHGNIGKIHRGNLVAIHAPLSYVGMSIRTWYDIMTQSGSLPMPNTTDEIVNYFGDSFRDNVTHGGRGWGIDQVMISLRLHQWRLNNRKGTQRIYVYQRQFGADRIDRANWPKAPIDISRAIDSHILNNCYQANQWKRLMPLVAQLHTDTDSKKWSERYSQHFNELVIASE